MADPDKRYPLSTPEGQPIPFEILRPHSFLSKTFVTGASTAAISIPTDVQILSIFADEDCIVKFATSAASAAALSDGVRVDDVAFVPRDNLIVLSPRVGFVTFAIRGLTADGTAKIQFIDHWAGVALASQFPRK